MENTYPEKDLSLDEVIARLTEQDPQFPARMAEERKHLEVLLGLVTPDAPAPDSVRVNA